MQRKHSGRSGWLAAMVTGIVLSANAWAADLVIVSQNALHYGWGATNPNSSLFPTQGVVKIGRLWGNLGQGGVGLMQEVMPTADSSKFVGAALCKVGTCVIRESNSYGGSWYKERYVFFITDQATLKPAAAVVECAAVVGATCKFSRPPASLLLSPASGNGIWVINFHAVWGRTVGARKSEAGNMPSLFSGLLNRTANSQRIVGGDWNLTAAEVSTAFKCTGCASPDGNTTLKADGSATSSSYDHFVGSAGLSNLSVLPAVPDNVVWRFNTSDHLGVKATATY